MTTRDELRRCPFCGAKPRVETYRSGKTLVACPGRAPDYDCPIWFLWMEPDAWNGQVADPRPTVMEER